MIKNCWSLNPGNGTTPPRVWAEALKVGVDEELFGERLHQATRLGRPLGDEDFVTHLEQKSGRPLRPSDRVGLETSRQRLLKSGFECTVPRFPVKPPLPIVRPTDLQASIAVSR